MNIFAPPLLGPFVERNNLSGGSHIGAAVTWTSNGEAYRLDLVRLRDRTIWSDTIGFAQTDELDLDDFLWHCFDGRMGLPEFLNELRPFFRPSTGAPTPANAGQWLNPVLVERGFTLGTPTLRNGNLVRVPVVWAFGSDVAAYGSRTTYARVGFIDWSPSMCSLLRRHDCWGTGAIALKRLLHSLAAQLDGPLLTEAGETRMQHTLAARSKVSIVKKSPRLLETDKTTAQALRKVLRELPNSLTTTQAGQIAQLSDNCFVGLLRSCVWQNLEQTALVLLTLRRLPKFGRENLVRQFIDAKWKSIWNGCATETHEAFTWSKYGGYNEPLGRALKTGDAELLKAILNSIQKLSTGVACYLVETAFEAGRRDLVHVIINSKAAQPVLGKCLLQCFSTFLFGHRRSNAIALYLLELGVRPIEAIDDDDVLGPKMWLTENENLAVLKRALDFEPPTEESIAKLLTGFHVRRGETFDWLCNVSKRFGGHKQRIGLVAFHATVRFIRTGSKDALELLDQALREGGALNEIVWSKFVEAKLLTGHRWRDEEGNWIDLIAYLIKAGKRSDAELLKKLRRPPKLRRMTPS